MKSDAAPHDPFGGFPRAPQVPVHAEAVVGWIQSAGLTWEEVEARALQAEAVELERTRSKRRATVRAAIETVLGARDWD